MIQFGLPGFDTPLYRVDLTTDTFSSSARQEGRQ